MQTASLILRDQGPVGFFRGVTLRCIRKAASSGIAWSIVSLPACLTFLSFVLPTLTNDQFPSGLFAFAVRGTDTQIFVNMGAHTWKI